MLTKKFKAESAARKTAVAEKASMQQKLTALQGDMQAKINAIERERDSAIAEAKVKFLKLSFGIAADRATQQAMSIRAALW